MLTQTNVNNAYFNATSLYTRPIFVNEISSPPPTLMGILHYCIFPLTKVSNLKMAPLEEAEKCS